MQFAEGPGMTVSRLVSGPQKRGLRPSLSESKERYLETFPGDWIYSTILQYNRVAVGKGGRGWVRRHDGG
jgi:hypothetical protein